MILNNMFLLQSKPHTHFYPYSIIIICYFVTKKRKPPGSLFSPQLSLYIRLNFIYLFSFSFHYNLCAYERQIIMLKAINRDSNSNSHSTSNGIDDLECENDDECYSDGSCYSQFYSTCYEQENKDEEVEDDCSIVIIIDADDDEVRDCRICHMSIHVDNDNDDENAIELGCCCKNDLAAAHKHCALTWFKIKGNK